MKSNGACEECKKPNNHHQKLQEIGELVCVGGISSTEHSFYQCDECGSIFIEIVDRGLGGHGRSLIRLTEKIF